LVYDHVHCSPPDSLCLPTGLFLLLIATPVFSKCLFLTPLGLLAQLNFPRKSPCVLPHYQHECVFTIDTCYSKDSGGCRWLRHVFPSQLSELATFIYVEHFSAVLLLTPIVCQNECYICMHAPKHARMRVYITAVHSEISVQVRSASGQKLKEL
jgi:hypothetical protein